MSCFMEKLPNFFGKSPHIFWTLYTSDNSHSVKWYIFCTKQMLCCWWDFVKFPCRVSMIVTSPQLHNHGIEHNNANTSRFSGHTKSYLAPPFNEIIWKHLKLSDDFRRILKTSEFIWIHLKIFWWFSENIWKQMKLSDDFRHCLKLPHLRREPSVFFSQKKTTRRNVIARGFGGLAPPSAVTKFNFCCFKKQQNWLWKQQILGSQTEKVRLTYLSTEVDVYVNFFCRKLLILRHFFGFSSNSII